MVRLTLGDDELHFITRGCMGRERKPKLHFPNISATFVSDLSEKICDEVIKGVCDEVFNDNLILQLLSKELV